MSKPDAVHEGIEDPPPGNSRGANGLDRRYPRGRRGLHEDVIGSVSGHDGAASQVVPYWRAAHGSLAPGRSERVTRAINVVIALAALALLLPLMLLIAALIRLTSRGPILYTQISVGVDSRMAASRRTRRERRSGRDRRAGADRRARFDRRAAAERRSRVVRPIDGRRHDDIGGQPFRIYKFRSMCVGAECGSGAVWAAEQDARVTPFGRVLRRCRLDELPQLINVLKGDMNIVGPRPERPSIFCQLREQIPQYVLRQRTRPGITGLAQIRQGYDTCVEDVENKVRFDLEYLQRQDLWQDLKIMLRTIPVMLFRRGGW